MKKSCEFLILILFFSFLQGCIDDRSKEHYKVTYKIGDHLFVEVFTTFGGGAFGGDRVSEYLTDSISFRKYIGTFVDSDEGISYKVVNDTLYIEKYSQAGRGIKPFTEKQSYNLNSLKTAHLFE